MPDKYGPIVKANQSLQYVNPWHLYQITSVCNFFKQRLRLCWLQIPWELLKQENWTNCVPLCKAQKRNITYLCAYGTPSPPWHAFHQGGVIHSFPFLALWWCQSVSKHKFSWGSWVCLLDSSVLCVYLSGEAPPTCCCRGESEKIILLVMVVDASSRFGR